MSAPWDKHQVTPEAERLVAQASAANRLERIDRETTWKDRLKVSSFMWVFFAILALLPFLAIWALFELLG